MSVRALLLRSVALVILGLLAFGCGGDTNPAASDPQARTYFELPDGSRIAAPAGSRYFYLHIPVVANPSPAGLITLPFNELVIARIDWNLCNPTLAQVQFYDAATFIPGVTWRIPTRVTTPLAGISVLGIFAGSGTLEGGLRVDLDNGGLGDGGASVVRVVDACIGDWVSIYGYIN